MESPVHSERCTPGSGRGTRKPPGASQVGAGGPRSPHGSAGEIRGALDLADAWGWQVESAQARALLDRELGLLWGLSRRGRSKDVPALSVKFGNCDSLCGLYLT
jgi:hypothetical protein